MRALVILSLMMLAFSESSALRLLNDPANTSREGIIAGALAVVLALAGMVVMSIRRTPETSRGRPVPPPMREGGRPCVWAVLGERQLRGELSARRSFAQRGPVARAQPERHRCAATA